MQTSYERLVRLLPIVKKHPETKMELLTMANQSNRKDFDINVKGLKGLRTEDNCHTDFAYYVYVRLVPLNICSLSELTNQFSNHLSN